MKILFIWPRFRNIVFEEYSLNTFSHRIMSRIISFPKPLTFPILVALTPKEYAIRVIEAPPSDINYDIDVDLVGITSITRYALQAYEIADEFRRRGKIVVIGGWHASALPDEAKQHADSVVISEAEETWPQLLQDLKNGKMKPFYIPERPVDPTIIPHPKNVYQKGTLLGVQATRGCPHGCEFCSITNTKFGNVFRMRPIEDVMEDINSIPTKVFNFQDNSLTINTNYTKHIFKKMKGLNKKFYGWGNINVLGKDDEFLQLASEAGCVGWLIGFESVSQESLNIVGKKTNIVQTYISSVKKIHEYGMIVLGSFVFGFDGDKLETFDMTDEFVRKSGIDAPDAMILTPYPGTPVFNKLDQEGRILTKDWNKYNCENVVFKPKHMTPEELLDNTRRLYKKWHKTSNILRRIVKSMELGFRPTVETTMQSMFMRLLRYQQ